MTRSERETLVAFARNLVLSDKDETRNANLATTDAGRARAEGKSTAYAMARITLCGAFPWLQDAIREAYRER